MQTFKNEPHDFAISEKELSLEIRDELIETQQALIQHLKNLIQTHQHSSKLLLTNKPNGKRLKELSRLIVFYDKFSQDDAQDKIDSDVEKLQELPLVISGWVYYSIEDIQYDQLEIGLSPDKNALYQALVSDELQRFLTGHQQVAINAYLARKNTVSWAEPLISIPESCEQTNFFNETDFIQKKRELPMSTQQDELVKQGQIFINATNTLQSNYQAYVSSIYERLSAETNVRSGRSNQPSMRHLKVLEEMQQPLRMLDNKDPELVDGLRNITYGHAFTVLDNIVAITKKAHPNYGDKALKRELNNNPLYKTLIDTWQLAPYMDNEASIQQKISKYACKRAYYNFSLSTKPLEEQVRALINKDLERLSHTAKNNAEGRVDERALESERQFQHQKNKSVLRVERRQELDNNEDLINAIENVRDAYVLNALFYKKLIGKENMSSGWYAENERYQQEIEELESLLVFIDEFKSNDHNMKMQSDIHQLQMLQDRVFGLALILSKTYPNSPLDGAIQEFFGFDAMSFSSQQRCVRAYRDYAQQKAEMMPEEDELTHGRSCSVDDAQRDHSVSSVSVGVDGEKVRLIAERDRAYEQVRPTLHKVFTQVGLVYNRTRDELAGSRYFGQARDSVWTAIGGKKAAEPAKHRLDGIKPLKELAKFANEFKRQDPNLKINTDIQKLGMLSDALIGAAVVQYEAIKAEYDAFKSKSKGLSSLVTNEQSSAMYRALDEVFKISAMSEVERNGMKGAYAYYQQKYQPSTEVLEKENGSAALFVA